MGSRVLHIHAGLPKTGTSAVQTFISRNERWLSSAGFSVPRTGYDTAGHHHALMFALCGPSPVRRRRMVAALASEMARHRGEALISSEFTALGLRYGWGAQGFSALRAAGFRLRFYLVLRGQAAFAVSAHPEFMRNLVFPVSFDHFLKRQALPLVGSYEDLIDDLSRWGDVVVLPYDPVRGWKGLMTALGARDVEDAEEPGRVNPSLGTTGVAALQDALAIVAPKVSRWNARMHLRHRALRLTRRWVDKGDPYNPLTPDQARMIEATTASSNARVAQGYWGRDWETVMGPDLATGEPGQVDRALFGQLKAELVDELQAELARITRPPRTLKAVLGRPLDIAADRAILRQVTRP